MQKNNPLSGQYQLLSDQIRIWAKQLGFQGIGITDTDLANAESGLLDWLAQGFNGRMDYMAKHGVKRSRPDELVPGTLRIISLRMNYMPLEARNSIDVLQHREHAFISRYAMGRDYHKLLRHRMAQLAEKISEVACEFDGRVFTDSAPVMEVAIADKAGIGWRGKHTLLLTRDEGSWFFLGEIYINLPLPLDAPQSAHCGSCVRCILACPTKAIIAPYQLDARRCISYLTIELKGPIPLEFRSLMGNRIYGCDDCQLACPWNRFARMTFERDFAVRNGLDDTTLVALFRWSEAEFKERLAGSPIYRIGYEQWLRNIAVAMGNAPWSDEIMAALQLRLHDPSELVREHVGWAWDQQLANNN
jgi:epoxyqueuosine reductase